MSVRSDSIAVVSLSTTTRSLVATTRSDWHTSTPESIRTMSDAAMIRSL